LKAVQVAEGVNEEGKIIINTKDSPAEIRKTLNTKNGKVWTVPATEIAVKTLGIPITHTAMLGAVARATELVNLESVQKIVYERFRRDLAEKNFAVIKQAYKEATSE
jgi:pyruvate ferredoxin oxidoreductase gamma subunit/2-oxoisovalerate ferredoxin oxidoreductase gamma subunit